MREEIGTGDNGKEESGNGDNVAGEICFEQEQEHENVR